MIRHLAIHDPEATAAERAEAMRIGEPKGPGEEPDGEEDDYMMEEDEDDELDDLGMEDGMINEGQQVRPFVFAFAKDCETHRDDSFGQLYLKPVVLIELRQRVIDGEQ